MPIFAQYIAVDREAVWASLFAYLQARLTAPPWAANTAYNAGDVRVDPQGHLQKALAPGTSNANPPSPWNDARGTTPDGSGGTAFEWQDTGAGFVSVGRQHIMPPALPISEQPALFVIGVKERRNPKPRGIPTKLTLLGYLIIYAPAPIASEDIGSETELGATTLNRLFQAIDQAMLPDDPSSGCFTLGGLVSHCWIDEDTDMDPGIFGSQAAAIMPVNILVP